MKIEDFYRIMEDEDSKTEFPKDKDNALMGLNIIAKYCPSEGIHGADHDIIYSVSVEKLVEAGITEEDAIILRKINWMITEDYLSCFV